MNLKVGLTFAACLLIAACSIQPMQPSSGHVQAPTPEPAGDIPEPVRITPILPKPKPTTRPETYSVVVNNVKVQELLFALARDAKLNVDIHSGILGSVTLNAIDQTLPQLLARISKQVDMRYELAGPNLAVMPDTPYLRLYQIDYVNMQRDTESKVGTSTQVATPGVTSAGGTASAGGGNESTTSISNKATNHFWETLVKNVQDILHETDKILPAPGQARANAQTGGTARSRATTSSPTLQVNVGTDPNAIGGVGTGEPGATFREAASVISNPETGVLSIRASSRQHEKIQEFLDQVLSNAKRQVLIEATIAEVQLSNQYQQGIDWSAATKGSSGWTFNQSASGTTTATPTGSIFVMTYRAFNVGDLLASVKLLETFGNVRVLSSPRLTVLNNQTAILKVVDNEVYFTIKADTVATANVASTTTFTTTPNIVAVGVIMNVTPQIGDDDSVLLNVRPSISRIVGQVPDPNPSLGTVVSNIPIIRTREMESLIKVNSGQIAVMGGLLQDVLSDQEDSVPGANRLLGLGHLFEHKNQSNTKTELVVFIRPIVIRDASINGDYRGYRSYLPDESFMNAPNPGK
ncbi:MAG: secretin N-terminal domain-containing protein, partial [Burkholderiales bacterium]|nr:secretin N-terminal domain-containing protein [Burkholderiales bacterium]